MPLTDAAHPHPGLKLHRPGPLPRLARCCAWAWWLLAVALLAGTGLPARAQAAPGAFGFEQLIAQAREAAARAYVAPAETLPKAWQALDYDALRHIRFRPQAAWWRAEGLPFELQAFHLGGGLRDAVVLHEIVDGRVHALAYDPAHWDFGPLEAPLRASAPRGHAGFRVHHALNRDGVMDELVVFLGASYFRALGRGQVYGLSARGLAIDTVDAAPGSAEEFPRFTAFWLERPAPGAQALVVLAQMDSPRATGAYRFTVRPGQETVMEVQARVFLRQDAAPLRALGIAPLTSMFQHGPNQPRASDYRPRVHDSDGLLLAATGPGTAADATPEWLWRPLFNPRQPLASSFEVQRLAGFGLMQRERRFAAYEDTEARYERRPSAWVEPLGDWGPGRVLLLQLPTPDETHDNVVAYWTPAALPQPGQALALDWRLRWQGDAPSAPAHGQTVQTRAGQGWDVLAPDQIQFLIDFDGPALRSLPPLPPGADTDAAVELVASAGPGGRVLDARAWPHPLGGWRARLRVQRSDPQQPLELRAHLRRGSQALTETWTTLVPQE